MYQRIRDLREDRDLLQNIPTEVLKALAFYYNTSVDYILDLTDEPRPYPHKEKPKF